jgi:hypothetical protein
MLDATALILLTSVAGIAGVIDAIAGGGGQGNCITPRVTRELQF